MRPTRPVSWLTPARKAFEGFPDGARQIVMDALNVAAEGGMAGVAKPMKGLGWGVFEVNVIKDRLKRLKEMLR